MQRKRGNRIMNQKEYTIVRHTFSDLNGQLISNRGYSCSLMYKKQQSFLVRSIRRIWNKLHLPFESIWYDKSVLYGTDKIVVFEPLCTAEYMKWLHKKKPNADIVFWYWNIAKNTVCPDTIEDEWCRKYSFARLDCVNYNMKFNPLPYFYEIDVGRPDKEFDIVFVGKDKGRLPALLELRSQFDAMGLKTKFVISPSHSYDKHPEYSPAISYIDSVKLGSRSKAVLDYIEVNNSGQSLRVIEALFQKEKIITNSVLVSDYDFYCPENIFILGKDDMSRLCEFLNSPYKKIDEDIIDKYDFDKVIERFFMPEDEYGDHMMSLMRTRKEIE